MPFITPNWPRRKLQSEFILISYALDKKITMTWIIGWGEPACSPSQTDAFAQGSHAGPPLNDNNRRAACFYLKQRLFILRAGH